MKKLISVGTTLLMLLTFQLHAQDDPKAKAILDELSKKTKSYSSIKASFSYNIQNKDQKLNETQDGTIYVKGSKYRLELTGQEVISDGKTVWTYLKDANEVQINNAPDAGSEDVINPSTIFTIYEKGFKYKFESEKKEGTKTLQTINLYPVDVKGKNYHTVKLTIDKAAKQVVLMKVLGKDGNISTYTVKSFAGNEALADPMFTFNKTKYPKAEVVDLR